VIPVALALFLLFADFTLKGPGNRILRTGAGPDEQAMKESLTGIWERYKGMPGGGGHDVQGLLCITPERFSYIEGLDEVREYFWKFEQGSLILSTSRDGPGISLKIEYDGEDLTVWWNDSKHATYRKTGADNTLDLVLSQIPVKIRPPAITQYRILERKLLTYHVSLGYREDGNAELLLDGNPVKIEELGDRVAQYRSELNKLDQPLITGLLWVDREMPMREVVRVKEELRKSNFLKIADGGYPHPSGPAVSPLLYSSIGLPRLLPRRRESGSSPSIFRQGIPRPRM
jgi:hypothetical protein